MYTYCKFNFISLHYLLSLQTQADLKAAEASLAAYTETKQSLFSSNRQLDTTVDSLKTQLHEETMSKKLLEQKTVVLKEQLQEMVTKKVNMNVHVHVFRLMYMCRTSLIRSPNRLRKSDL